MKKAIELLDEWLEDYLDFERIPQKNMFWLDTMEFLCDRFSHPELGIDTIHIAGSKGKGSVSSYIASILECHNLKVGLYTSPHILSLAERIGSAHKEFPEVVYESALKTLVPLVDSIIPDSLPNKRQITWFELVTLYAFLCYREYKADCMVLETGMGGRLDATNVCSPLITVITPIELEHTEYLGNTIEKIAYEKAGIIKPGIPVCVFTQQPEALNVITQVAKEKNAPLFYLDDYIQKLNYDISIKGMEIDLEMPQILNRPIHTNLQMPGKFQGKNAALAILAIKKIYPDISEETIEKGLALTKMQGRFEIIQKPKECPSVPFIIYDGAHTVNSLTSTLSTCNYLYKNNSFNHNPLHILFACAQDKNMKEMALLFYKYNKDTNNELFDRITLTKPGTVKATDLNALSNAFTNAQKEYPNETFPCLLLEDHVEATFFAIKKAQEENAPLLVTGSFYLIAQVKKILSSFLHNSSIE